MTVYCRPATLEDAAGMANVEIVAQQTAYRSFLPAAHLESLSVPDTTKAWYGELQSVEANRVIVAVQDDTVIGFVRAEKCDNVRAGITHFFVLPEYWGKGVGDALMITAIDTLRQCNVASAVLWVFRDNPRARRFYERHGWQLDGRVYNKDTDSLNFQFLCYQRAVDR